MFFLFSFWQVFSSPRQIPWPPSLCTQSTRTCAIIKLLLCAIHRGPVCAQLHLSPLPLHFIFKSNCVPLSFTHVPCLLPPLSVLVSLGQHWVPLLCACPWPHPHAVSCSSLDLAECPLFWEGVPECQVWVALPWASWHFLKALVTLSSPLDWEHLAPSLNLAQAHHSCSCSTIKSVFMFASYSHRLAPSGERSLHYLLVCSG